MTSGERSHEPRTASRWKYGAVPVIGLTGGLASGKSSVARLLLERGFALIDADAVGHEVLDLPEVQRKLLDRFGPDVVPGRGVSSSSKPRVDRKALGAIVFADPNARHFLESIVHQLMRARFLEKIEKEERSGAASLHGVVLDAAILFEAGWELLCDSVAFVDTPRSLRLERSAVNRGWADEDFAARERAQWPSELKRRRADFVIQNDGERELLRREVDELVASLPAPAGLNVVAPAQKQSPGEPGAHGRQCNEGTGSDAWRTPCSVS